MIDFVARVLQLFVGFVLRFLEPLHGLDFLVASPLQRRPLPLQSPHFGCGFFPRRRQRLQLDPLLLDLGVFT